MQIEEFKLERWLSDHEEGISYDLSGTCVNCLSINDMANLFDFDISEILSTKLVYRDLKGSDRLKSAICNLYKNQSFDNITVTLGGIGANQLAIETIVEKGDKVVCICPTYQQCYSLPKIFGAKVELVYLNHNDWSLDFDRFEKIVGEDTKLICFSSPCNPTGMLMKDVDKIIEIACRSKAYILSDEVYRGLSHFGNSYSESIADLYEKGIATGSMSKTYSLAGIRVGWIIANKEITDLININRQYNTIAISTLDDYVSSVALENHKILVERNLKTILQGKQFVSDFVKRHEKLSWVEPNSTTVAFIKQNYSDNFVKDLWNDTKILLVPSESFDMKGYFRLGYGLEKEYLKNALNSISNWIIETYQ